MNPFSPNIEQFVLSLPAAERKNLWRQIEKKNDSYPTQLIPVPESQWPKTMAGESRPVRVMRSRDFIAMIYLESGGIRRISIKRTNFERTTGLWNDDISWEELMVLKHEVGFGELCAVEVFPPDKDIVNVASMRHLWILPVPPHFMWGDTGRGLKTEPPNGCPDQGACHGPMKWCDFCGDVGALCDDAVCDVHHPAEDSE